MGAAPQRTGSPVVGAPFVVRLRDLDAASVPLAGGKAANLGELLRAGLPVPDGFCVTTQAYDDLAAAADIGDVLDRLAATSADDRAAVAELAREARERVLATPMPRPVAEAVTAALRELGEPAPVAVRSSATAEDLPSASAAGQQDTYLGVVGTDAVLDAVHRCWASLFTERAVVYRLRNR